jgi:hypothetical protein
LSFKPQKQIKRQDSVGLENVLKFFDQKKETKQTLEDILTPSAIIAKPSILRESSELSFR